MLNKRLITFSAYFTINADFLSQSSAHMLLHARLVF